jgi:hypothetical protein
MGRSFPNPFFPKASRRFFLLQFLHHILPLFQDPSPIFLILNLGIFQYSKSWNFPRRCGLGEILEFPCVISQSSWILRLKASHVKIEGRIL